MIASFMSVFSRARRRRAAAALPDPGPRINEWTIPAKPGWRDTYPKIGNGPLAGGNGYDSHSDGHNYVRGRLGELGYDLPPVPFMHSKETHGRLHGDAMRAILETFPDAPTPPKPENPHIGLERGHAERHQWEIDVFRAADEESA